MKATLALAVANAVLAAGSVLQDRAYVTDYVDVKTVTNYVYPDGSPVTGGAIAQPTAGATYGAGAPAGGSSGSPSSGDEEEEEETDSAPSTGGSVAAPKKPSSNGSVKDASLYSHNAHRANHTCQEVGWDDALASYAQQLADTCSYGHDT